MKKLPSAIVAKYEQWIVYYGPLIMITCDTNELRLPNDKAATVVAFGQTKIWTIRKKKKIS